MVAVRALAGDGGRGAGEVERHHRAHQPGGVGVGVEPSRGQMRQGGVLEVGVDRLDDRVPAVDLVGGDGIQVGVKNA